jgi:HD-GYP domain-containing protein (c-di-GMP phosphodiesterase class II)
MEKKKPSTTAGRHKTVEERLKKSEEMYRLLANRYERLTKSFGVTINILVSALEMRDPYTAGHQQRSANVACAIAQEMGLAEDMIEGINIASTIHDIGNLSIPVELLIKPSKLTGKEYSKVKEHARYGFEMFKDVELPWPLAEIIYQHHERMDGSGYPRKLKGNKILMEARVLAVADVVDAMSSQRPYRASLGLDAAIEEIEKNRGILYDDAVSDACLRLFRGKSYRIT